MTAYNWNVDVLRVVVVFFTCAACGACVCVRVNLFICSYDLQAVFFGYKPVMKSEKKLNLI